MCRWMAWHGQPVIVEELLFKTQHSLIDQSLHSRMGAETTNGDGFGMGWYGAGDGPAVYRSVKPAWGDANLSHLAGHIESPLFLAHIRAAIGSPVQETNCHPFQHGRWLLVHNGFVNGFRTIRRELMFAIDPTHFEDIEGSTDSEVMFRLALTFGLEDDPLGALERTLGFVEAVAERHGIDKAIQASIGVSDGLCLWAVRYSTEGHSRTLFVSEDASTIRHLHPENERLQRLEDADRIVVSEPLADLAGAWHEIPESTALVVHPDGAHEFRPFKPRVEEAPPVPA
jgi:predicted glutamine amidotransferase